MATATESVLENIDSEIKIHQKKKKSYKEKFQKICFDPSGFSEAQFCLVKANSKGKKYVYLSDNKS